MIIAAVAVVIIVAVAGGFYLLTMNGSQNAPATVIVNMPSGAGAGIGLTFTPQTITVVIGVNNTIKWVNQDTVDHTVSSTSGPSEFGNDGTIAPGASFTTTLTMAGTYQYRCTIHTTMTGTIIVKSG